MVKFGVAVVTIMLGILACNGSDVTRPADADDFDAIYHIITIDRPNEFNLNLIDFSIPDTLLPNTSQLQLEHYWFDLTYDSLDLPIEIDYPDTQDSLGTLPEALAREIRFFYGTLEIIGVDTAGGGQDPVRLSKEFFIRGEISGFFKKYGSDYNRRRGWLLTDISDAAFSASYPGGITQIAISSASYPQFIVTSGLKSISDIPAFAPGESLTVTINGSNLDDIFRIRIPIGAGFQTINVEPVNNNLVTGFRLPESEQYNHFLVEAIGESSFLVNGLFRYESVGVLFEIE